MSRKLSGTAMLVLALLLAACAPASSPPDAQGIPLPGPGRGAY